MPTCHLRPHISWYFSGFSHMLSTVTETLVETIKTPAAWNLTCTSAWPSPPWRLHPIPGEAGESDLMVHGCQSSCPELLFFESLSHQTELQRGCEEGKAQGSPAALWEQSGPPDAGLSVRWWPQQPPWWSEELCSLRPLRLQNIFPLFFAV